MAIFSESTIRTKLSQSGHAIASSQANARVVNDRLSVARAAVPRLNLAGVSLVLQHLHWNATPYEKGESASEHRHEEVQIEYVIVGQVNFTSAAGTQELTPGCGNLIAPALFHAWESRRRSLMLGMLLKPVGPRRAAFCDWLSRSAEGGMWFVNDGELAGKMLDIISHLHAPEAQAWRRERVAALLYLWLTSYLTLALDLSPWMAQAPSGEGREQEHGRAVCDRAAAFMEANYAAPLQLEDIALQAGISVRHLNRLFRQHRQGSVADSLLHLRLSRAHEMLQNEPDRPVKSVAYACGFSRPAYFTYRFRKHFGHAPTAVRHSPV